MDNQAGCGAGGGVWTEAPWAIRVDDPSFVVDPDNEADELGGGAFGFVIRAKLNGVDVAAKTSYLFLYPKRDGLVGPRRDPNAAESLQLQITECMRESEALQRLEHPMVVKFDGVQANAQV